MATGTVPAMDSCYTLIGRSGDSDIPTEQQLKKDLESAPLAGKVAALKMAIQLMLDGEKFPGLLMTIIRFVMPLKEHVIKKLLLIYWEIVPKKNAQGKLLHEMILVCDAYRRDLLHPNEFIRGSTLRFLCKLKESELLEPLLPSIRQCLEHRHSYVRRNAVLAIFTIYKNFDFLLPDAPELIYNFLASEQDMSCKRNAFMMLIHADQDRALDYLGSVMDQVEQFGDILQLVIVELIQRVCRTNPALRGRFIRCVFTLLQSSSAAVRYEAATTIITLSSAPTAVKAATACYIDLAIKQSDNNVKLIVLDRINDLKENATHERVLQELIMDVIRVLVAPDLDVRRKTLDIVLDLTTRRNVDEVVQFFKKEIGKTMSNDEFDCAAEYRQLLVKGLHECGVKFPQVAVAIVPVLMEFIGDQNSASANEVILFVREAVQRFPDLCEGIIYQLLESFPQIMTAYVYRAAMWIMGEFTRSSVEAEDVLAAITKSLGDLPIVDSEVRASAGDTEVSSEVASGQAAPQIGTSSSSRILNPDGTYATQSALTVATSSTTGNRGSTNRGVDKTSLRGLVLDGDMFLGAVVATTLTKVALTYAADEATETSRNSFTARCLLIMASLAHVARSNLLPSSSTDAEEDSVERIMLCIRVLVDQNPSLTQVFKEECRSSFATLLAVADEEAASEKMAKSTTDCVQADDLIHFRQLKVGNATNGEDEDAFELNLSRATGFEEAKVSSQTSKLNKVFQLTGFSDPVYAEAYVTVNQYDISLDVLIVNQTGDTLQNFSLELATLGDLKLVERPSAYTLGAYDFCNVKANIKVSSTETGIIFGSIVYDVHGAGADRNCVVMDDIHIDIMDYIMPFSCSDADFRSMWAEFEWENKVSVNTNFIDLNDYLQHILKTTNMKCLTPQKVLEGDCGFLAANLYAKSVFGEDSLANLSIEKSATGHINGHIRIRSKTQGIALSLGDKVTLNQRIPTTVGN